MKCLRIYAVTLAVIYCCTASADLEQGYLAFQRGDFAAALEHWRPLAEAGDMTAQFNLGQMYRLGKGVEQNDRQATKWYAMAARQGSSYAQHNLKLMARDGRISEAEYQQAINNDKDAISRAPRQKTAASDVAPSPVKESSTTSQQWLNQLNPKDYVVQLLATPQKDALATFLANHRANLETSPTRTTSIVRTSSKGQDWYVLLLGPFANEQGARDAVAALPPALRDNQPWVRQVSAVRAIARK